MNIDKNFNNLSYGIIYKITNSLNNKYILGKLQILKNDI